MERFIIIFLLSLSLSASNKLDLNQIYNIIKHVETNNKATKIGDGGKAYGIVQIHKICVQDINRIYNTEFTHKQAFSETYSREMFMLYIQAGIKRFKMKYCRSPTEYEVVRMWNGGIYNGYKKTSTLKYLKRYILYKRKLNN